MEGFVYARFTAHVSPAITIIAGEVWRADAPLVRAHPDWFSDDFGAMARTDGALPVIEEATAEPGARRTTSARK